MRRNWFMVCAIGGTLAVAGIVWQVAKSGAQDEINGGGDKKAVEPPLPIRQVVLFNSGVGYFQREGEVSGNSQVDLSFNAIDINDLLKSLIFQDLGGGKISTVSYDSYDPIDKILHSFALDLNGNPSFGQILNQARGEKVELLVRSEKKDAASVKVQGTIVGMEGKRRQFDNDPTKFADVEALNISGPSGLQAVNLDNILGVRFLNPTLENEFQRALRILASAHDTQKKTVSLGFNGPGKRAVRVGYVVDSPLWKTSYRLRVEPNGKIFLQGWALVDNQTDDDWNNVRMVLVSGRPISFEMNLYEPIYIPRPVVEPELFASLRPPLYDSAMGEGTPARGRAWQPQQFNATASAGAFANPFGGGGAGGVGGMAGPPSAPVSQGGPANVGGFGQGFAGGQVSGNFGGGGFSGFSGQFNNPYQGNQRGDYGIAQNRLTYETLQQRRLAQAELQKEAKGKGPAITGLNFKEGIASVASASEAGDYFHYVIDQKITLSRQKSAMLPILDQFIEGAKVSIFNESVHAKHPLLGLRLKNTSGQPLTQGPITVYDDSAYAGDTRILDLQPNEERLLSYALDTGTEIKTVVKETQGPDMHLRLGEPNLTATYKMRRTRTYLINNRSTHDRTIILEQPIQSDWELVEGKPSEKSRGHYRFTVKAAAGKAVEFAVSEEQKCVDQVSAVNDRVPYYAIAYGIHVKEMSATSDEKLVALRIENSFLKPTLKMQHSRTYHIQNLSEQDRTFAIDYIIRKDWVRIDPRGDAQRGPAVHSFKILVPKGKTGTEEIVEELVTSYAAKHLVAAPEKWLRDYLAHPVPSAEVKAVLSKVLALQAQLAEAGKHVADLERTLKVVNEDQARLRENLKIIPQTSDPYKRFLDKFVAQETEIETLQKNIRQAQAAVQAVQREFDQYVARLNAE